MNAEELRSLQAPLKAQYREHPETALVTLRAKGHIGKDITCKIELAGCAGVTLRAVATALGIPLRDATIRAEGDLDFRGTLGVSKDAQVGFHQIRLHFDFATDASEEQLATLIRLTERYCVVYQTLSHPAKISVLHRVISQ
ncbi:MAG: peroxiredoxin [Verrucomicrobia bacterium]|nr:MAG: peroxiredoxin [Verrucomicrobiota bacterium]